MHYKLLKKVWDIKKSLPVFEKESQGFKFKYVSLDQIVEALTPLLDEHGLAYYHQTLVTDEGQNIVVTTLYDLTEEEEAIFHTLSLAIPDGIDLAGMNGYQSLGSALTYFRRYNLVTMFDILADQDVDSVVPKQKAPKKDYVKAVKELIAAGKHSRAQIEGWFGTNRGLMTPEQRTECIEIIKDAKI